MTKLLWRSTVPAVTLQVGGQGAPGTAVPAICCHSGPVGALRCIGLGAEPAGPLWVWAVQSAASSSSDFSEMVLAGIGLHTQEGSVHKQ